MVVIQEYTQTHTRNHDTGCKPHKFPLSAPPELGLRLQSILLLFSNCFANEAHPGRISKHLCYMCSFLQALVSEPSSFCMHMHSTSLSAHGRLDKHAKLGGRWKPVCLCLVSLSVCLFCVPEHDWHGLSNNMAGRQYESLVGIYPLKWYSIIFWWTSFFLCLKLCLLMMQGPAPFTLKSFVTWRLIKNKCCDVSFSPWQRQ